MAFDEYGQTSDAGDSSYEAWENWSEGAGTESTADPVDNDSEVITEPDDRSDVSDPFDWNDYDEGTAADAINKAEYVLGLAAPALKVLAEVVQAAGSPQAAAALKTLSVTAKIAGGAVDYVSKQINRRSQYGDVPVSVPTGPRGRSTSDDVLAALSRVDD